MHPDTCYKTLLIYFSPPELQFYTSAAAVIMLIPAWVFLLVGQRTASTVIIVSSYVKENYVRKVGSY